MPPIGPEDTISDRARRVAASKTFDWLAKLLGAALVSAAMSLGLVQVSGATHSEAEAKAYDRLGAAEAKIRELEHELDDTRTKLYQAVSKERDNREAHDLILEGRLWQIMTGRPKATAPGLTQGDQ